MKGLQLESDENGGELKNCKLLAEDCGDLNSTESGQFDSLSIIVHII